MINSTECSVGHSLVIECSCHHSIISHEKIQRMLIPLEACVAYYVGSLMCITGHFILSDSAQCDIGWGWPRKIGNQKYITLLGQSQSKKARRAWNWTNCWVPHQIFTQYYSETHTYAFISPTIWYNYLYSYIGRSYQNVITYHVSLFSHHWETTLRCYCTIPSAVG